MGAVRRVDVRARRYLSAVTVTEERRDGPVNNVVSMNSQWKLGPDPRNDPDVDLTDEELDAKLYPSVADISNNE